MADTKLVEKIEAGRQGIRYTYAAGKAKSYFYTKLRDEKKIVGVRCPQCKAVYVPPIDFCRKCFIETTGDWVEVSDKGIVWDFTIPRVSFVSFTEKVPYIYAQVKLDGVDDWIYHIVREANLDKAHIGMRIEAVWAEDTGIMRSHVGNLFREIRYFRPVDPAERVPL